MPKAPSRIYLSRSEYSSFLRFCNEHTRLELRRQRQLYIDAGKVPSEKRRKIEEAILLEMQGAMKKAETRRGTIHIGCRSAGPYVMESVTAASEGFSRFWTTRTTLFNEASSSASNVNPTFVYSLIVLPKGQVLWPIPLHVPYIHIESNRRHGDRWQ